MPRLAPLTRATLRDSDTRPSLGRAEGGLLALDVLAGAALEHVLALAALEHIGAGLAEQAVLARAAVEGVLPGAPADHVFAAETLGPVTAAEEGDHIRLARARDRVLALGPNQGRGPPGAGRERLR